MEIALDVTAFLVAVAFVAGFIDALAGGGALLVIPALLAVGVPPVSALATNKMQSTCGTGGALLAFVRKGRIDWPRFSAPAVLSFVGSAAGAFVVQRVDPSFLAAVIPVLLIAIAVYFLAAPGVTDDDRYARIAPAGLLLVAPVIGFYDGFFGPGAGSFYTAAQVALFGSGMVGAIAHTKLLNFASSLAGFAVLSAGGHALLVTGLAMAAASVAGNQVGAHMAMRFGGRAVRPLLVVMCLALTAKLLSDPANPLRRALFP